MFFEIGLNIINPGLFGFELTLWEGGGGGGGRCSISCCNSFVFKAMQKKFGIDHLLNLSTTSCLWVNNLVGSCCLIQLAKF